jgi:hypothetical protein
VCTGSLEQSLHANHCTKEGKSYQFVVPQIYRMAQMSLDARGNTLNGECQVTFPPSHIFSSLKNNGIEFSFFYAI